MGRGRKAVGSELLIAVGVMIVVSEKNRSCIFSITSINKSLSVPSLGETVGDRLGQSLGHIAGLWLG